jgi:L-seryl-tRNA(Ser) seleniumtransferase
LNFSEPTAEELALLRADPLLWEQELDVRPEVARDIERAVGRRAGQVFWRSAHDHLYSLELADLGREHGIPVMEDLGSGSFVDLRPHGFPYEPTVPEVVAAGVDLVSFSGDKLLGGPQAGIVVGRRALVERLQKNPLNRALRIDKLTLAALEATLYTYEAGNPLETVPALRMLTEPLAAVRARARRLLRLLNPALRTRLDARVVQDQAQVGGGALPTVVLPTAAVAVGTAAVPARVLDEALRAGEPAAIGRIADDRLLLDCRTVLASQVPALARALSGAAGER